MPDRQPQIGQQGFDQSTQRDVWWDGRGWTYEPTPPALPDLPAVAPGPIPDPGQSSAHAGGRTQWSAGGAAENLAKNIPEGLLNTVIGGVGAVAGMNPVTMGANATDIVQATPSVVRGLGRMVQGAASDPYGAAIDVADAIYRRPVETVAMLSPLVRAAGLARTATAMDVPAAMLRGLGAVAQKGAKGWMGAVAKIPQALKDENPGIDLREVLLQEGMVPTLRGGDKGSKRIKGLQAQTARMRASQPRLIERTGPEGRIVETPIAPAGTHPLGGTGTGTSVPPLAQAGHPQVRDIPPEIGPPLGVERTGTGWLEPQQIPVSPGPLAQVTGTSASRAVATPGAVADMPGLATPGEIVRAPRPAPGTEELRTAIGGIDPVADTDHVMRNAFQKELDWYEGQMPNPIQAERLGNIKSQLQDQVSYGIRQPELGNQTLAKKKLAVGARRVESEAYPDLAPVNQRIGRLSAAEEAAVKRGEAWQNQNVAPMRWAMGTVMGGGAGLATGNPYAAFAAGAAPFVLDHPVLGGLGAIGAYRAGSTLKNIGQVPSALGITSNAIRDALLEQLANSSTERPR